LPTATWPVATATAATRTTAAIAAEATVAAGAAESAVIAVVASTALAASIAIVAAKLTAAARGLRPWIGLSGDLNGGRRVGLGCIRRVLGALEESGHLGHVEVTVFVFVKFGEALGLVEEWHFFLLDLAFHALAVALDRIARPGRVLVF